MKIKKVAALALAAVMGASMLAGCASKSIDEDAVVVKMKDGEVRLGVANFMARYTQYTYDSITVPISRMITGHRICREKERPWKRK